ncbi:MAG: ureidoglycolate lyase [Candidatus Puniceispirillum sp.]
MTAADRQIRLKPLTEKAFAKFGDVLAVRTNPDQIINQGMCGRHHNLAKLEFADGGKAGISLFDATPRALPYRLDMMERHPKGSQAFVPMHDASFLVIVAADENGQPSLPQAFLTAPHTGINIHKNIWHGVLTPLSAPGLFAVIDRIGNDTNLQEHWFDEAYTVIA